uniref:forkhead box protein P2-like isoform X3 n=1 Tax=Pristiophorus japonicus TaxID=55135 RepID=UPI00398E4283
MTGAGERSKAGESSVHGSGAKDIAGRNLPHTQPQLLYLGPLHYHQLLHLQHQGLLTLKLAHLAVAHHMLPQGANLTNAAWFRHEADTVHAGDTAFCAAGLLVDDSYPLAAASSSARATSVILHCSPAKEKDFVLTSVSERDPALLNPLFVHGFCKWPGCEQVFKEYEPFLKHLNEVHCLDDTSTAQCLIQKEKVKQLESKLELEKDRLVAMQTQLTVKVSEQQPLRTSKGLESVAKAVPVSCSTPIFSDLVRFGDSSGRDSREPLSLSRQRLWEKHSAGFSDINPSLEYYKIFNVRPPLTYAALIRWAILETADRQLTLNEIYHWFTRSFAFFRYHTATWKNAVRHNLSLHKCFVRVENIKGAVWTVDELEFQRRRGQKIGREPETRWNLP